MQGYLLYPGRVKVGGASLLTRGVVGWGQMQGYLLYPGRVKVGARAACILVVG